MAALQVLHNILIDLEDFISPDKSINEDSLFPMLFLNFEPPVELKARNAIANALSN